MAWKIGDRVELDLPDHQGVKARRLHALATFAGTVTSIDRPGVPTGVEVTFDALVNGSRTCYATHSELRREGIYG